MMSDSFSEIRSQLREVFLEEAATLVDQLEESLLALEGNPDDEESLKEAFRAAHTIKGSAAGVGFNELAAFTHQLENALDALRARRCTLSPAGSSALLEGVDLLRAHLAAVRDGSAPLATEQWASSLPEFFPLSDDPTAHATARSVQAATTADCRKRPFAELGAAGLALLQDELSAGARIYAVRFTLPSDCFARGLDPVALLGALAEESSILQVTPLVDCIPPLEEIDPTACYLGFSAVVATRGTEADLNAIFEFCPEGSSVDVTRLEHSRIGEVAARNGREALSDHGGQGWKLLGEVLVEEKLLQQEDLEKALAKQRESGGSSANGDGRTIRVKQEKLDSFMNLVGELVTARNALLHLERLVESEYQLPDLARRMKETTTTVSRTVSQLQNDVLSLRMVALGTVFQRLPRIVRDVAASRGKRVALHLNGQDTEVDKTVADALVDPMTHLVRNAADHGIESPEARREAGKGEEGQVWVSAWREGSSVVIEVRDDGAGIDPMRVRQAAVSRGLLEREAAARLSDAESLDLVFAAGLSTASEVSDISGRGVGMDVVRSNVARMGGTVSVTSKLGQGTCFRLQLPLTLSVFRALLLRAGGETLALPLDSVREMANVTAQRCKSLYGRPVLPVRGQLVGLVSLAEAMGIKPLDLEHGRDEDDGRPAVVVEAGGERVGLIVDAVDRPQEILVKPLDGYLSAGGAVAGASVMGDGRVALVLDPAGVVAAALAHVRSGGAGLQQVTAGGVQ